MKKKILCVIALALVLALAMQPAALAEGGASPFYPQPELPNSLRNFVDEETEVVNIRGTEIDIKNVVFLEDTAIGEELAACIGEVPEDAMIMPVDELPPTLKTEIRKESVREHEEALAKKNAEKKADEEPDVTRLIGVEENPSLDREASYLYLVGKPVETGTYLIMIYAGNTLYLCSQDVLTELPDDGEASDGFQFPGEPSAPAAEPEIPAFEPQFPEAELELPAAEPETPAAEPETPAAESGFPEAWTEVPAIVALPEEEEEEEVLTAPQIENTDAYGQPLDAYANSSSYVPPVSDEPTFFFPDQPTVTDPPVYYPTATDPPVYYPTVTDPPAVPLSVYVSGPSECRPGESVMLSASVSGNSGWISYQWYYTMGPYSAPVDGANNSRMMADTSRAGVWNYFCLVTDSAGRQAISDPLTLTVVERQVRQVSIETMPRKLDYYDGQPIDTAGLCLLVRYDDGTVGHVYDGFTIVPETAVYTGGSQNVIVRYNDASVSYNINVRSAWDQIRGIAVLNMPNKTSYRVGDTLDTTGLVLRVYSVEGGYIDTDRNFTCSPTRLNQVGNQVITVTLGNKTCTFTVAVQEDNRILSIALTSLPANRSYTVGDPINTAGLALQVRTNNGYETVTSGYTYTPRVATTAGTQTITVLYGNQSATFTVDVRAATAPTPTPKPTSSFPTPTPRPTNTPAPTATAQAAAAPRATSAPARRNTGVGAMVKILFVVALLALAGLVFIVLYLRKQDRREDSSGYRDTDRRDRR